MTPRRERKKSDLFAVSLLGVVLFLGIAGPLGANHVVMHGGPFLGVLTSITVDPVEPDNLYAVAFGGGVFRSRDRGASWTAINQGLPDRKVFTVVIHPTDRKQLYLGTDQGIYHSRNQGDTWEPVFPYLRGRNIRGVHFDPASPDLFYVATDQGVFRGQANTWDGLSEGLSNKDVRTIAISSQGTIFAGTFGGVFKKERNQPVWTAINHGLADKKVRSLAIDPASPATLYAGTASGGVFKTINGGTQWKEANRGLLNSTVLFLVITPSPHKALYAATIDGVFKSLNGGDEWVATGQELAFTVPILAFDPTNSRLLYAGSGGHLYKTIDAGATWEELSHQVDYFGPSRLSTK